MSIVQGKKEDQEKIFQLLKDCGQHMIDNGLFQWNDQYPTVDLVQNDLENQSLYCKMIDGEIAGIVVLDDQQSPEYADVDWQIVDEKVVMVHRLAVSPAHQNQGIARQLMDFAEQLAIEQGYTAIRLDAYSINDRAVNLYKNRGYSICGEIFFPIREKPFYCFERKIG